jgi:hypothetical protein
VQQLLDPARLFEGLVGAEAQGGRELHLHRAPELAAEIAGGAVQRLHGLVGLGAAQRQHERGGVAQVGADAHFRHGDDLAREVGVGQVMLAQDLGQRMAHLLSHAQLPLPRRGR